MIVPQRKHWSLFLLNARICALGLISFATVTVLPAASAQRQSIEPHRPVRERILIDEDWRFQKNDPAGATGLLYDVRPPLEDDDKDKAPDAAAVEAVKVAAMSDPQGIRAAIFSTFSRTSTTAVGSR